MTGLTDFERHVFTRLDSLEGELRELREVTWPVCQGMLDKNGHFENKQEKISFFKFLFLDEIKKLLRLKATFMGSSPSVAVSELQWVLVEVPGLDAV
jgi:hypothetical protein